LGEIRKSYRILAEEHVEDRERDLRIRQQCILEKWVLIICIGLESLLRAELGVGFGTNVEFLRFCGRRKKCHRVTDGSVL
jgi:hypothetical protein